MQPHLVDREAAEERDRAEDAEVVDGEPRAELLRPHGQRPQRPRDRPTAPASGTASTSRPAA